MTPPANLSALRTLCFKEEGATGFTQAERFSGYIDAVLLAIYADAIDTGGPDPDICLVALGGYGRKELCPFSDVDIILLHTGKSSEQKIAHAVRNFWDAGLILGCVVRTLREVRSILGSDLATDTALLQTRYLAGNKQLFETCVHQILKPYFQRHRKGISALLKSQLRNAVFSAKQALFCIEPDLKNGLCTLRDCQRMLWIETVRHGVGSFQDFYTSAYFSGSDASAFTAAYDFLLKVRIQIHMLCERRIDVLETALQDPVARELGFGPNAAGKLMEKLFTAIRTVRTSIMLFFEQTGGGRSIIPVIRKSFGATRVSPDDYMLDGILYHHEKAPLPSDAEAAAWILQRFRNAQMFQATLSVALSNSIHGLLSRLSPPDFHTPAVDRLFSEIISHDTDVGRIISAMHDCGVLAALIPAFGPLTCKVEYDSAHEYTVDQHILLTLS
ncbi:MAG: hypothetical protein PHC61_16920, partial [Chitinivibrionales bacterium]|nr:hypothetical protein [Chitinivibrionales bacterium]